MLLCINRSWLKIELRFGNKKELLLKCTNWGHDYMSFLSEGGPAVNPTSSGLLCDPGEVAGLWVLQKKEKSEYV